MSYKAQIKIFGRTYSSEGDSVSEAITNLKPEAKKGTGVLKITNGEKSKDLVLTSSQVSRLFALSPSMREVAIKNTSGRFNL